MGSGWLFDQTDFLVMIDRLGLFVDGHFGLTGYLLM
jgi:hypothetical protein